MNKKAALMLTLIIGFVALVVGILIGVFFITPASPQLGPTLSFIKANSCDADELCETNSLSVSQGNATFLKDIKVNNRAYFDRGFISYSGLPSFVFGNLYVGSSTGNLTMNTGAFAKLSETIISGEVQMTALPTQNSTANYLCIDGSGNVFKKATPCR